MKVVRTTALILTLGFFLLGSLAQDRQPELYVQSGHSEVVYSIDFSFDGNYLVSASESGVILWDLNTGLPLRRFGKASDSPSTTKDGNIWFSNSLRSLETGDVLKTQRLQGPTAVTPDGKALGFNYRQNRDINVVDLAGNQIKLIPVDEKFSARILAVSGDGRVVAGASTAAAGSDSKIRVWEISSGKLLGNVEGHSRAAKSIALSKDGKLLASCLDYEAVIWEIDTKRSRKIQLAYECTALSFAPNGSILAISQSQNYPGGVDAALQLVNVQDGKTIQTLKSNLPSLALKYSHDGKLLAVGSGNGISVIDTTTYQRVRELESTARNTSSMSVSHNGSSLAVGNDAGLISLWDLQSNKEPLFLQSGIPYKVQNLSFDPGSNLLLSGGSYIPNDGETPQLKGRFDVWNVSSGQNICKFDNEQIANSEFSFNADGKSILAKRDDPAFSAPHIISSWHVYDCAKQLTVPEKLVATLNFENALNDAMIHSPAGDILVVAKTGRLGDGEQNFEIRKLELWNIASGEKMRELSGSTLPFGGTNLESSDFTFSPNGKKLIGVFEAAHLGVAPDSDVMRVKIWDLESTEQEISFKGHFNPVRVAMSPDENHLAVLAEVFENNAQKQVLIIRHVSSGRDVRILEGEKLSGWDFLSFSADNRFLFVKGGNGEVNLIDVAGGRLIARLVTLDGGNWLVITPEGLFDGTPAAFKRLIWRFDNNTFNYAPVEAFFKEFYRPGLLQEIMSGKPLDLTKSNLATVDIRQPEVKILSVDGRKSEPGSFGQTPTVSGKISQREIDVAIEAVDNVDKGRRPEHKPSSGAQDLRLFRGGSLVKHWRGDVFAKDSTCEIPSAKPNEARRAVCKVTVAMTAGDNELTAYAFNEQNVKSNDSTMKVAGADVLKRKGKLWVLAIGVNEYANKDHNLKYAVPDAVDFGAELRKRQVDLNNYDTPDVIQLVDRDATKRNILLVLDRFAGRGNVDASSGLSAELIKKLAAIEKVQPEDAVVIYFAGHGTAAKDRFYLIPHEGFPKAATGDQERVAYLYNNSVSDLELEEALRDVDAGRMIMVIDACNSGQALEAEEKRRGPMNSRGLAQLAYEKGMLILTAAQSYQAALEVARTPQGKKIEHGLLTYSLLEGLSTKAADADGNRYVIDREWLNYAVQQVPQMQLEAMRARDAEIAQGVRGPKIFFANNDNKNLPPEKRGLQTPRVFYRRESSATPLVVSLQNGSGAAALPR